MTSARERRPRITSTESLEDKFVFTGNLNNGLLLWCRCPDQDHTELFDPSLLISLTGPLALFSRRLLHSRGVAYAVLPTTGTSKRAQCKMRDRGTIAMIQSRTFDRDKCTTALKPSKPNSTPQSRPVGDGRGSGHAAGVPILQAQPRPNLLGTCPEKSTLVPKHGWVRGRIGWVLVSASPAAYLLGMDYAGHHEKATPPS
jgi:hypothetical protein